MSGVEWHPLRPFVAVSTNHGNVYVWWTGTDVHESWSAFAPNFKELEANEEYVEKEDEFDIVDSDDEANSDSADGPGGPGAPNSRRLGGQDSTVLDASEPDVDITSVDAIPALGTGADDGDIVLPSVPEVLPIRHGHGADADAEEVTTHYDTYGYGVQETSYQGYGVGTAQRGGQGGGEGSSSGSGNARSRSKQKEKRQRVG